MSKTKERTVSLVGLVLMMFQVNAFVLVRLGLRSQVVSARAGFG